MERGGRRREDEGTTRWPARRQMKGQVSDGRASPRQGNHTSAEVVFPLEGPGSRRAEAARKRMWQEIREKGSELGGSTKAVLMQQAAWNRLWLGNCSVNARLTGK